MITSQTVARVSVALQRRQTVHFDVEVGTRCGRGKEKTAALELITCTRCLQGLLNDSHHLRRYCESRLRRPTFIERQEARGEPKK